MSWPTNAQRSDWFSQQYEASKIPDPTPEPRADDHETSRPAPQETP